MVINGIAINAKDLNQRYANTYVEIRSLKMPVPTVVYIQEFSDAVVRCAGSIHNTDSMEITRDFPQMGAVNYRGEVHFIMRKPLRQWSRGLYSKVLVDFCRQAHIPDFSQIMDMERATAMFNRKWEDFDSALFKIKQGECRGVAIDPLYWIGGIPSRVYLWRGTLPIGEFVGKRLMFFPNTLLLKQEVKDELRGKYEIK